MTRWATRFRRAASLLLGVHLLQVILLAASAVCDRSAGTLPAQAPAAAVHAGHHGSPGHGGTDGHDAHLASQVASPVASHHAAPHEPRHDSHHGSHTTDCPMAMACAASAVLVPVEQLATVEVRVPPTRITHETRALHSLHLAPEPPPPRG